MDASGKANAGSVVVAGPPTVANPGISTVDRSNDETAAFWGLIATNSDVATLSAVPAKPPQNTAMIRPLAFMQGFDLGVGKYSQKMMDSTAGVLEVKVR